MARCDYVPDYLPPFPPPTPIFICLGAGTISPSSPKSYVSVAVFRCDQATGAWRREEGDAFSCGCSSRSTTSGVACEQSGVVARCFEIPEDARLTKRPCGKPRVPDVGHVAFRRDCRPETFAGYYGTPLPAGRVRLELASASTTSAERAPGQEVCEEADTTVRVARDPNEKRGWSGDLVPGQAVTYTVSYENEGAGVAYGVYVTDELSPHLDETTLELNGQGEFFPAARTILWDIGQLAAKGAEGSKGERRFSVQVKPGLPSGTLITNQAVVYFPSVPEETPTNTVVNVVQPLAAVPQSLETQYGTAVAITLAGRDVSGTPLTYAIEEPPRGGELTGTPPDLLYTPAENFTGQDRFAFTATNGVSDSRVADVTILVTPSSADTVAPEIVWTYPEEGAVVEDVHPAPISTDDTGSTYAPSVFGGFSEAMDAATITNATVRVVTGTGREVDASVLWDGSTNQAVLQPREPWRTGSYTATVTTDTRDASGNALVAGHSWSFRIRARSGCTGDCDGNGQVTIDELIVMVNAALGNQGVGTCRAETGEADPITIDAIVTAVNHAVHGCV